ncbi:MAG: flagellar basal body L-ring protein FlgH [Planctomycetes bacterium]|nr:flagellar basal body L-ring protein FlgH [Planctomycetota bacterium]MCB9905078.1 flagellar basal body L-ring protein FlgH [Planctomycetota bacterium]
MKHLLITILATAAVAAPTSALSQERRGSIYDPNGGPFGLVANKTAARPGDLVTVLIQESQDLKNEEKSDLKTQKALDTQLTSFNIAPNAFNTLPDVKSSTNNTFAGTANYEKKGNFTARLTAMVVDALPNGNLVISGRREIRIDNETKVIEFSGVVRRYDITAANTIESELVANARVSYSGSGPLTRSTNRHGIGGFLHDAFIWLWPF